MKTTRFQVVFLRPEMQVVEFPRPIDAERWANRMIKLKEQETKERWVVLSIEPLKS